MSSLPVYRLLELSANTSLYFFFNDTATTEIYTLSLHDALPISLHVLKNFRNFSADAAQVFRVLIVRHQTAVLAEVHGRDRKSTRLNSSHDQISYAVFCLKKKKTCSAFYLP